MSGTSESAARRLRDRGKAAATIRPACVRKLVARTITDWRLYSRLTVAAAFAQWAFPQRRARPRTMDIAILLTLVLINGLFAMSEIALVTARKPRQQRLADAGSPSAKAAIELGAHPTRLLSTLQIGITAIGVLNGIIGEATFAEPFALWLQTFGFQQRARTTVERDGWGQLAEGVRFELTDVLQHRRFSRPVP